MHCTRNLLHYTKKVKNICPYLDLNTKVTANSEKLQKHLEKFKISLTFVCSVDYLRVVVVVVVVAAAVIVVVVAWRRRRRRRRRNKFNRFYYL